MFKYYLKAIQVFEASLNLIIICFFLFRNLFAKQLFNRKGDSSKIFILGNGPSLKSDFERILSIREEGNSMMAVNSFCISKMYDIIRPDYYVIADPGFFENNPTEEVANLQESILNSLINNTYWEMTLFVPYVAKKFKRLNSIMTNSSIKIVFVRGNAIYGGFRNLNNYFYKLNLATPVFFNVLSACIFYSIKLKFKEILLWGGDHSWHEQYTLSRENRLFTMDKHFYDDESEAIPHVNVDGSFKKVHEEFLSLSRAFESYHVLKSYADYEGVKIKNFSSISWIDAFTKC